MDSNEAPKKKSPIQPLVAILASLGALLAYVAVLGAVSIASGVVIRLANPGATEEKITELTYSYATLSGIIGNVVAALLLFVILLIIKRKIAPTLAVKKFSLLAVLPCILLGAAFNLFSECIISLIPFPESVLNTYKEIYSYLGKGNLVIEIVGIVVITPIVEEIFFRGIGYRLIRKRCPVPVAVILSSLLFGLAHGNLLSFVYTTVLGAILAVCFEAHGSIFVPILIHASFNATSYFAETVLTDRTPEAAIAAAITGAVCALAIFAVIRTGRIYKKKHNSQSGIPDGNGAMI